MINLYEGITPNHTATHYIFSNFTNYLTMLENFKLKEITPNNYTIDNLYIRCKLDETLTTSNYKNVTYIINTVDEVCYFVNSMKVQSGYVYFSISIDNWGTYLHKASLKDILIKRCNRKLNDNGIYDEIKNTNNYSIELLDNEVVYEPTNLMVIVVLTANSQNFIVGALLDDFKKQIGRIYFSNWEQFLFSLNGTVRFFYSENPEGGSAGWEMKKQHVYIVPTNCVTLSSVKHWLYSGSFSSNFAIPCYEIHQNSNLSFEKIIDINKRYSIGGVNGVITFNNKTNNKVLPLYYFSYSLNNVTILITDGDAQQEVTASFEVPLIEEDANVKASQEIGRVLRYFMGASQIGLGIFKNSPLSIVKGINTVGNQISNDIETPQAKGVNIVATGSAINSYGSDITHLHCPFISFSALSIKNEEKHARKLGATFNEYVDTITEIYNKELLGTGATTDDTFIQANMEVSNIPTDAINDITGKFNNGVNTQLL